MKNATKANLDPTYLRMIQSLLTERKIIVGDRTAESERGTPQGGRASPLLYRIGANNLLTKLKAIDGIQATAFADDTAIVVGAESEGELQAKVSAAMNAVAEWARTAEIRVNEDKTEIISIGRSTVKRLRIGADEIELKRNLKYLGIIIDDRLKWREHIDYLAAKTERLLLRVISTCWSRGILKVKDKLRLYKQVFLPMMIYGHEIWFEEIRNKSMYIDRINRLQRRILRAIVGAYKNVNTDKMLELTGVLPIDDELKILNDTKALSKLERSAKRAESRRRMLNERQQYYDLSENFEIEQTRKRESVWCLTETGPFRKYLTKIGKEDDDSCRLCGGPAETAQHLLYECDNSEFILQNDYNTFEFEQTCYNLVKFMRRL